MQTLTTPRDSLAPRHFWALFLLLPLYISASHNPTNPNGSARGMGDEPTFPSMLSRASWSCKPGLVQVYCLPDGYEIEDRSLDDVRHVLNPRFSAKELEHVHQSSAWSRSLDGIDYMPGLIGMNNMKMNDYANVVIQSVMRILPIRWELCSEHERNASSRVSVCDCLSVLPWV